MAIRFCDAHCHIQLDKIRGHLRGVLAAAVQHNVKRLVVLGTNPDDWSNVLHIAQHHCLPAGSNTEGQQSIQPAKFDLEISPQIGLHPWHYESAPKEWLTTLRDLLIAHPTVGIGECGLNRLRATEDCPVSRQLEMTEMQIQLAIELQRPLTFHCVRAYSDLLHLFHKYFSKKKPHKPGIVLHAFLAPVDLIPKYSNKTQNALKSVPLDRLLLETDSPDHFLYRSDKNQQWMFEAADKCNVAIPETRECVDADGSTVPLNEPARLPLFVLAAAQLRNSTLDELAEVTWNNAQKVYFADSNS